MRISIIGCGWLGLPLGEHLAKAGHTVLGSTTREEKLPDLAATGIEGYLFKLEPMPSGKNFNALFDTDLLIVNIPPGRKRNPPEFYEEQVKYLHYLIDQHKVPKVIFVSSTSYYPSTNAEVNVNTPYDFDRGSSRAVVQGEKQIAKIKSSLLILRCGGLMGGDRIPGRWFAGKPTKGAQTPVNYIHRDDLVAVIHQLSTAGSWDKPIMNLVNTAHPTRKAVHEAMAKKYGFAPPLWQDPALIPHKIVSSDLTGFSLKYPSPLDY